MLCRELEIADSSRPAEIAGEARRVPASSKFMAKTTTKTV